MKIKGNVFKFGDNVDTDVIIPARYLNLTDPKELARHCMEDIDISFVLKVRPQDIIVAGENFGCGSSREHAPLAIKASGVGCVIARSFARIFYRNAVNIGLPILECSEAGLEATSGDLMEVDLSAGKIVNWSKSREYNAHPFPEFILELIRSGGLLPYIRKKSGLTPGKA